MAIVLKLMATSLCLLIVLGGGVCASENYSLYRSKSGILIGIIIILIGLLAGWGVWL